MIHTDGRATIASRHGDPLAGIASKRADLVSEQDATLGERPSVSELIVSETQAQWDFGAVSALRIFAEEVTQCLNDGTEWTPERVLGIALMTADTISDGRW